METVKKGIIISRELLKKAGIEGEPEVEVKGNVITLKPKNSTRRFAGIIKKTPISIKELDKAYEAYLLGE